MGSLELCPAARRAKSLFASSVDQKDVKIVQRPLESRCKNLGSSGDSDISNDSPKLYGLRSAYSAFEVTITEIHVQRPAAVLERKMKRPTTFAIATLTFLCQIVAATLAGQIADNNVHHTYNLT